VLKPIQRALPVAAVLAAVVTQAHAQGEMPQFDFSNPLLLAQVVWGAVIFVALYFVFSRVALPQVASVIAAREEKIGGDLEQARLAKDRADKAVAELNEARRVAFVEAQTALAQATQKAKDEAAARSAETNARLDRQLAESEKQIGAARAGAMAALREAASDTADMLVTRLTGRAPDAQALRTAVAEALTARGLAGA
jgi:F-type H+-transporting ATPase subunit b